MMTYIVHSHPYDNSVCQILIFSVLVHCPLKQIGGEQCIIRPLESCSFRVPHELVSGCVDYSGRCSIS